MINLSRIKRIVDIEYARIVVSSEIFHNKLRIFITDGSFADTWFSTRIPGRFSYHWEKRHIDGRIYRHDNFPDPRWEKLPTFPKHFHNGSQEGVKESQISDDPMKAIRQFMEFIQERIFKANQQTLDEEEI